MIFLLFSVVVVLLVLLASEILHRRRLLKWLADPELARIPEGRGDWDEILARLQRMRKDELKTQVLLKGRLDHFRLAAQALPDGIVLLDHEGHIEWMNSAACTQLGLHAERDIGTLIVHLIRHASFQVFFQQFRAGQTSDPLILQGGTTDTRLVLALQLLTFADSGILLLSRDISETVRTETIRRDFIANVSHELRTPLTVIAGFLEILNAEEAPNGEIARNFLRLMAEQSQRMNRLVEDLLTLSQLENDTQPPREESIDMHKLLETLASEARALSAGQHQIIIGERGAGNLTGNPDELRSAFGNLVSNAVRYSPPGGSITLAWRLENDQPVFSVTDTGIGIPVEHIPRLTERFYRIDKGRSTATGGTGLGLAIVKHVLMRHGGALHIESEPGRGSTFSARLPASRKLP